MDNRMPKWILMLLVTGWSSIGCLLSFKLGWYHYFPSLVLTVALGLVAVEAFIAMIFFMGRDMNRNHNG